MDIAVEGDVGFFLIIGAFVFLVILIMFFLFIIYIINNSKSMKKVEALAKEWGFSFEKDPKDNLYEGFNNKIFSKNEVGVSFSANYNYTSFVIKGNKYNFDWQISHFVNKTKQGGAGYNVSENIRIGGSKSSNIYSYQTLFVVKLNKSLPIFTINNNNFIQKSKRLISNFSGAEFVDFEDSEFNEKFIVEGKSQEILNFFDNNIMDNFKKIKLNYTILSNGRSLMFFNNNVVVQPENFDKEMQNILEIVKILV